MIYNNYKIIIFTKEFNGPIMKLEFFGQYLLRTGAITAPQLNETIEFQYKYNEEIGAIAIKKKILTEQQTLEINKYQLKEDILFGEAAIKLDYLNETQVDDLLKEQKQKRIFLGDAIVKLGFIAEEKKNTLLFDYQREQNERIEHNENNYPEKLIALKKYIDQFALLTIKIIQRMTGIYVNYDNCKLIKKGVILTHSSYRLSFSGSFKETVSEFILLIGKKLSIIIAQRAQARLRLKLENQLIDEETIDDIIAEIANVICSQVFNILSRTDEMLDSLPEKCETNKGKDTPYSLKEGEKGALVKLVTPEGAVSFLLIFSNVNSL